jgi:hypothetical protein|eukprot:COSAG01_NODE_67_length_29188_cov_1135.609474_32_plen_279_part_00
MFWCAAPDKDSADPRKVSGKAGQACFFFNNGCDISCDECDGQTGQVVHPRFIVNGSGAPPSWSDPTHRILPDPKQSSPVSGTARPDKSRRLSICKVPKHNATICDARLRTMNIDAPCGSKEDATFFAPWRYPGAAPVIDSCGVAGGVYQWQGAAAAGGDYQPTINAKRGDLGSKLPRAPSGTVWKAGEVVEVAWTHKACELEPSGWFTVGVGLYPVSCDVACTLTHVAAGRRARWRVSISPVPGGQGAQRGLLSVAASSVRGRDERAAVGRRRSHEAV